MSGALNCVKGDMAFVKASKDVPPHLHDRIVNVLDFLGTRPCPCCNDLLENLWVCELAGKPISAALFETPKILLRKRLLAIQDRDLRPIRPGPDPERVDTGRPIEQVAA